MMKGQVTSFGHLHFNGGPPPTADRVEDVRDLLRDPAATHDIFDLDGFHPQVQNIVLNTPISKNRSPT